MATRSTISLKTKTGGKTIYCHWDGFPSNNGKILIEHYNTEDKVKALLELGDLSSLAPSCEKPVGHTFDNPIEGHCVSYGRDRGEDGVEGTKFENLPSRREEWNYMFQDGKWLVAEDEKEFEPLTDEIIGRD